jgi:hypothetical protein
MQTFTPTQEHQWLGRFVGEWRYTHDVPIKPGEPATRLTGREVYRAIGGLWVQGEAIGPMPDGALTVSQTTLSWDPAKARFMGTFLSSAMPFLWVYDGELEDASRLVLYSEGPRMDGGGGMALYKDVMEFQADNTRTLTAYVKRDEGTWDWMMVVKYEKTG